MFRAAGILFLFDNCEYLVNVRLNKKQKMIPLSTSTPPYSPPPLPVINGLGKKKVKFRRKKKEDILNYLSPTALF